jgi:hypothetical protein
VKSLNCAIDFQIKQTQKEISTIIAEKKELTAEIENLPQITIRDREYIENKTKVMITRCENMMDQLEESFKPTVNDEGKIQINFSLYGVDVYAKLVNSVASQVRELRELNRMAMGIDVINTEAYIVSKKKEPVQETNTTIKMTSSDLLKLIKEAGASNQLNAIDAEFDVINQKEYVQNDKSETNIS